MDGTNVQSRNIFERILSMMFSQWIYQLPIAMVIGWGAMGVNVGYCDQKIPFENQPETWQEDADLTDLFFLNQQLGWAVGSQGVILRTINGGREWLTLGQAITEAEESLSLQDKLQAFQSGIRTSQTGIADGKWQPNKGSYSCRFESIFFIDEKNGWVAGGYDVPYMNQSRGVILRTSDGGVTWTPLRGVLAGRIKRIGFTDNAHGWAIGDPTHASHGGVYFTSDGGQTWSSNPAVDQTNMPASGWRDGEATSKGFAALTYEGHPMTLRDNQIEPAKIKGAATTTFNRIRLINDQQGWAVGDRGAVCHTQDGGRSWNALTSETDSALSRLFGQFDFQAIALSPSRIWLAGFPGSVVFSIDRNTGQIFSHSTGNSLPIHQMHFVDDQTGWMVGALGTILGTTDGGKTWNLQRGEHRNIAALVVAVDRSQMPLEALAMLSAEENKILAVTLLGQTFRGRDVQAIDRLGGGLVLSIPPVPTEQDTDHWELENLVRMIRALRPLVVICHSEFQVRRGETSHNSRTFDPDSMLQTAVRMAADRSQFIEQIEFGKLEPWQVDRIAIRSTMGKWSLDPQMMLLRNACLIEDKIAISRALIGLTPFHSQRYSYRIETFQSIRQTKESDIFSGLSQFGKKISQRSKEQAIRGTRSSIETANRKSKKLEELSRFELITPQDVAIWYQQIQAWTAALDESLAGTTLLQLAESYLKEGKIELAVLAFESMLARCPGHPLESAALLWLAQYYTSDEFAWLEKNRGLPQPSAQPKNNQIIGDSFGLAANSPFNPGDSAAALNIGQPATRMEVEHRDGETIISWTPVAEKIEVPKSNRWLSPTPSLGSNEVVEDELPIPSESDVLSAQIQPAAHVEEDGELSAADAESLELTWLTERRQLASRYLKRLAANNPEFTKESQFQQLEMHLTRRLGGFSGVESALKRVLQKGSKPDGLFQAVQRELVLGGGRPLYRSDAHFTSMRTRSRPYLDGELDDPVWQEVIQQGLVTKMSLGINGSMQQQVGAGQLQQPLSDDLIMMAHDEEFLYIGIRCHKLPHELYSMTENPRTRDADLSQRDRVEFHLDVDRDYRTAFRFSVDYRGWCRESLDSAIGWNPQWYIARAEDETSWTIELAIPWREMVSAAPGSEDVWTIHFSRKTRDLANCWQSQTSQQAWPGGEIGFLGNLVARPTEFELLRFQ